MADLNLLSMLKIDLGFKTNGYDDRLNQLLTVAEKEIIREGAETLDKTDLDDAQLIVMYAAWLWRKRDTGEGMPRMLRWELNNRVFDLKQD